MKYRNRTLATIDLGTNSILMLVVQRDEEGKIHVLYDGSEVVRLGENLKETGNITQAAIDRTILAIQNYQKVLQNFQIEKIFLTGTSAMREAKNQTEVFDAILAATNIEIEVLPKVEEVRLSYKSVLSEEKHEDPSLVIDIGGGSTEVGWGLGKRYDGGRSMNLGTIKLLEGPLPNSQPTAAELESTRNAIDVELKKITPLGQLKYYYGTAGSFTQAAALELKLTPYSSQGVDHFKLTKTHIDQWIKKLVPMTLEERKSIPGIDLKRMDVLIPGLLIIERLFLKFGCNEFIVRDRGIRFGKAFDQFRDFNTEIVFHQA